MRFGEFDLLLSLLILVPFIVVFHIWAKVREKNAMSHFAGEELLPVIAPGYRNKYAIIRVLADIIALALIIVALAKPQWGFEWKADSKKGLDILFAVDTSKSMMASDIKPTRLDFAKEEMRAFVKRMNGDRVGLIAFAGQAFLQCPLTVDYGGFVLALDGLNIGTIPIGGTSISSAIEEAIRSLSSAATKNKVLVIITDGENTEGDIEKAIKEANKEKVMICAVGIGTKEGDKIKISDDKGNPVYLKNRKGEVVESRLMEETLFRISERTGGIYVKAGDRGLGLDDIYKKRFSQFEKNKTEDKKIKIYKERFQIPLWIAFVILCFEITLRGKIRKVTLRGGNNNEKQFI
ncbi:MAG: VWA domain-containing protein [Candidatus Omnitrophica bacterium]|nr:VWA domain-containing protein [Candidatus Omnitrophota bacterium]